MDRGATHILFSTLVVEAKVDIPNEDLIISIHQILAKLGTKGRTFINYCMSVWQCKLNVGALNNDFRNCGVLRNVFFFELSTCIPLYRPQICRESSSYSSATCDVVLRQASRQQPASRHAFRPGAQDLLRKQ